MMDVKESLKEEIVINEKLSAMRGSPGWKIVEEHLNSTLEAAMNRLLTSSVERDIFYNQAVVVVIKELLEKIGISYIVARNAREELKKYEEN